MCQIHLWGEIGNSEQNRERGRREMRDSVIEKRGQRERDRGRDREKRRGGMEVVRTGVAKNV